MPTITYNFEPQQTVYVITTCDRTDGGLPRPAGFVGLQISNSQFPGAPDLQVSPVSGNDLLVREGVVQEVRATVAESVTNQDAQITVDVLGGVVVAADIVFPGVGYFPNGYAATISITTAAGEIVGVSIDDPGAGYTDGTGFQINITDPSLWSGGAVGRIDYDVVDGQVTNAVVAVPGTGYVDGVIPVGFAATNVPYPAGAVSVPLLTTAGGTTGSTADLLLEIQNGEVTNVVIQDAGGGYTDGATQLVTDVPPADSNSTEIVYLVRLTGTAASIYIEVPVALDGEEQQGDIFTTRSDAIDEYELRVS